MARGLVMGLCLFLTACAASLTASSREVAYPGVARVVVDHVEGSTVWLLVYNLTSEPLSVDRDAMLLVIDGTSFDRDPGTFGSRRFHVVPAGGVHDVKLKFGLPSGAGKLAVLHLEKGVIARGYPVPVPPLYFRTR